MEDKGQKLYEMYQANMLKQNVSIDDWNDLQFDDQTAWRWTADQVLAGEL